MQNVSNRSFLRVEAGHKALNCEGTDEGDCFRPVRMPACDSVQRHGNGARNASFQHITAGRHVDPKVRRRAAFAQRLSGGNIAAMARISS